MYHQFSNIRRTQSPNINVSRLVLQLSLPSPLKPHVKLRMKMLLEQRRQAPLILETLRYAEEILPECKAMVMVSARTELVEAH